MPSSACYYESHLASNPLWLDYIASIHQTSIDLGLDRILPIAHKLNLCRFDLPVVTVAGTNGKGSCIAALRVLYEQAGYCTIAYTSPHIEDFRERLLYRSQVVDEGLWCDAFSVIEQERGQISLSFFEFTTLAALWISRQLPADVLLLEIGLGGRLDAVNVVDMDVAVITSIDIDHQQWLGNTRDEIAREKAGIVRPQGVLVCGEVNPPDSLQSEIAVKQAHCYQIGRDFAFTCEKEDKRWGFTSCEGQYDSLPLPRLMLQNVATALMVQQLLAKRLPVDVTVIREALGQMSLAGRFEVIEVMGVSVVLDVAHNPAGCRQLAQQMRASFAGSSCYAVVGMLEDKPIAQSIEALDGVVERWYLANLESVPRGASLAVLEGATAPVLRKSCYTGGELCQVLPQAVVKAREDSAVVLVFGSFHTVALAKQCCRMMHEAQQCHQE